MSLNSLIYHPLLVVEFGDERQRSHGVGQDYYREEDFLFGGTQGGNTTQCVLRHYEEEKVVFIGFRGSHGIQDWLDNAKLDLVPWEESGTDQAKAHQGGNSIGFLSAVKSSPKLAQYHQYAA